MSSRSGPAKVPSALKVACSNWHHRMADPLVRAVLDAAGNPSREHQFKADLRDDGVERRLLALVGDAEKCSLHHGTTRE